MNAMQRMRAMVEGKPVDRPGYVLWGHMPMEDRNQYDFVKATMNQQNNYRFDFVKLMPNGFYLTEDYGQKIRWPQSPFELPFIEHYAVNHPKQWLNLPVLDPTKGALAREVEAAKRVLEEVKGTAPVIATVFSPIKWAQDMYCGDKRPECISAQIEYSPNELHHALQVLTETNIRFMERLIEAGVDGFFFSQQLADNRLMTVEQFEEFGMRYDLEMLACTSKTWFNMMHIHGPNDADYQMFEQLLQYPVQVLNWEDTSATERGGWDLKKMRSRTDKILCGGINRNTDFNYTDREELKQVIRARVKQAIADAGSQRLIIGPSCGIQMHIPRYRFNVLLEVMDEVAQEMAN